MAEGSAGASGAASGGEGQGQSQATQGAESQAQSTQGAEQQAAESTQPAESQQVEGQQEASEQAAAEDQNTVVAEAEKPTEEVEQVEQKPAYKYQSRLDKMFPDRKYESDDDRDAAFNEYLDSRDSYYEKGVEANKNLIDFFEANPKAASAIRDSMTNAVPFHVALAKHFGPEDLTLEDGDDHYADFDANRRSRQERLDKQRQSDEAFQANIEASQQAVEEFAKQEGMDQEKTAEILNKFDTMMAEVFTGKVTPETLQAIKRAVEFDAAVAEAKEIGEKKGKNEKIVAETSKPATPQGDGIPAPAKTGEPKETKVQKGPMDDLVDFVKDRDVYNS